MKNVISIVLFIALFSGVSSLPAVTPTHEGEINDWRERRHARLASDDGWLTLVGLEWLREGANRIGNSDASTLRIAGGPADWGTVYLAGDQLTFAPAKGSDVQVEGREIGEDGTVVLVADNQGQPTVVRSGNLSFYVIFRESYALRVKDTRAQVLRDFSGVPNYRFKPDWRYEARFTKAEAGETIEIGNVLGQLNPTPVYGYVEFERDGVSHRLLGLGDEEDDSVWFLFADRTNGKETYGAGRFLYSDGLPENGRLVVDFNKAYNPPCAFNEFSTCPLPPQQNRLDLKVTAGEKKYHAH